jgi:murein DD-endopeptidase MepM/ murein hydrolase activator NlpD
MFFKIFTQIMLMMLIGCGSDVIRFQKSSTDQETMAYNYTNTREREGFCQESSDLEIKPHSSWKKSITEDSYKTTHSSYQLPETLSESELHELQEKKPSDQAQELGSISKQNIRIISPIPKKNEETKMDWPIRGNLLNSYGQEHEGIDIIVPEGTSVKAAESGIVIYANDGLKEFGKTILVLHKNKIVTVYGYNQKILVTQGQKVNRGLHFEIRKNSHPVNPMKYLKME